MSQTRIILSEKEIDRFTYGPPKAKAAKAIRIAGKTAIFLTVGGPLVLLAVVGYVAEWFSTLVIDFGQLYGQTIRSRLVTPLIDYTEQMVLDAHGCANVKEMIAKLENEKRQPD